MAKAIGLIEYRTVSAGITAADLMVKTAEVELIQAETVCPGKYYALIRGTISAVKSAVDAAKNRYPEKYIDSFILGNPHDSIFGAIWGTNTISNPSALGILETYSIASAIVGADVAAKTAEVNLIELRLARGMCGKSYMLLTGEVAAVSAAIEKAKTEVGEEGMFLDSSVIANPDQKMWEKLL